MNMFDFMKSRKCTYEGEKYTFLDFYTKFDVIAESPMIGGHCAGQISWHMAVIEDENGNISHVPSYEIKFIKRTKNNMIRTMNTTSTAQEQPVINSAINSAPSKDTLSSIEKGLCSDVVMDIRGSTP